jgi:ribonuclease HII
MQSLALVTLLDVAHCMQDSLRYERPLLRCGEVVVGLDEVGRGALAGPLTVGAVVLAREATPPAGLNDSKLLTRARREALVAPLESWATDWSLGSVSSAEIDDWGLRLALAVAGTRALDGLRVKPTHALIDGSFNLLRASLAIGFGVAAPPPLRYSDLACTTIVNGDRVSATIAAASVLAKVQRDQFMVELSAEFGGYCWAANKGYGAPEHLEALRNLGPTCHHRQSWRLPGRETRTGT